jgi:hypothetical protein
MGIAGHPAMESLKRAPLFGGLGSAETVPNLGQRGGCRLRTDKFATTLCYATTPSPGAPTAAQMCLVSPERPIKIEPGPTRRRPAGHKKRAAVSRGGAVGMALRRPARVAGGPIYASF